MIEQLAEFLRIRGVDFATLGVIFDIGSRSSRRAVRVPAEPPAVLDRIESACAHRRAWVTAPWIAYLKTRVRRRGLRAADQVFGVQTRTKLD